MIDEEETLAGVMEAFELPPMEEALPFELRRAHRLGEPVQYGIACRHVRACVREAEALGAGPFLYAKLRAPNWTERGRRKYAAAVELAVGYAGHVQIELLGPGEGTDLYAEALRTGDAVLHHVGVYQSGLDALEPSLVAAGFPQAVRGGLRLGQALSVDFRYYDTRPRLGHYLELLDLRYLGGRTLDPEPLLRLYARLARRRRASR